MNKPTQDLRKEHGAIMLMLKIMAVISNKLKTMDEVNKNDLLRIVEFVKIFADKCHHGKEEDILFPYLFANPQNGKILNELLGEHKTGRDLIRGIAESLEKYQRGNADAIHIAINLEEYIKLLTSHILKENTVLFPLVNKQLSQSDQAEIEDKFESLEKNIIGEGKHEEYHRWLQEFKEAYLVTASK